MSPSGSSSKDDAAAETCVPDFILLLFGCRQGRKGVAVHCHANSPKPVESVGGAYSVDVAKLQAAGVASAGDVFCFTGDPLSKQQRQPKRKNSSAFGAHDHYHVYDGSQEHGDGGAAPREGGAEAIVAPSLFFCTGFPGTRRSSRSKSSGGVRLRRNGCPRVPEAEEENGRAKKGARSRSTTLALQQEKQQRSLHQLETKPSFRRKNSGSAYQYAPALSGRVAIVPRQSLDSAAKPAPSPPSGDPSNMSEQQSLPHLGSDSSFGSFLSVPSDDVGAGGRRDTTGTGRRSTATANWRRRSPIILDADMPRQLQEDAKDFTVRAMDSSSDHEDVAASIKKEFDQIHGAKWHCIVGQHFGSFVTAEQNHFVHLHVGKVAVLLFKAGP